MKNQHTPEPWSHIGQGDIVGSHGDDVTATYLRTDGMGEANARRIVACVNALEGLNDHALLGGWSFRAIERYAKGLEKHCAELLSALEFSRDKISELHLEAGEGECHYPIINDAIDFVKGSAS
jgi:hypothetical protein